MLWVLIVVLAVVLLLALLVVALYNRLVRLRNRAENAWAQVDVQLRRRYDLIPNLVETVKGYMAHERQTLEAVIAARNAAAEANARAAADPRSAGAVAQAASAENALTGVLGQFMALREAYPDLKANQNALRLMEELSSTENRVAFARQAYNDAVMLYNTQRQSFPTNFIAGAFGFAEAALFQIDDDRERQVVNVSLSPGTE